jgi:DNA-binding transcriptional LysR family regulator
VEIRHLRHVLALIEQGNYHRAAETLGMTQPALSRSIQQAEGLLGVRLFDRHGKSVVPTVYGSIVSETARRILGQLDALPGEIERVAGLDTGRLAIGAGPYVVEVCLGAAAGRLLKRHPGLLLEVRVDQWDALPDLLRRGAIDLFIASVEHVAGLAEFRTRELPQQPGIWVCRAGHPLSGRRQTRRALVGYPIIGARAPESIRSWLEAGANGHPTPRRIETTSVELIRAMLREGDAVSLVHPAMVRRELASGELVRLDFDAPPITFRAGIVWLAERTPSPAAVALIDEVVRELEAVSGAAGVEFLSNSRPASR